MGPSVFESVNGLFKPIAEVSAVLRAITLREGQPAEVGGSLECAI
jgi:hypothetical protein